MTGCCNFDVSAAKSLSRRRAGRFENSRNRSVRRKSKTKLRGYLSLRNVVFPTFLAPQRKADWSLVDAVIDHLEAARKNKTLFIHFATSANTINLL